MRIADDAAPGAECNHGSVEHFSQFQNVVRCFERAGADEDHWRFARCNQLRGISDAIGIGQWRRDRL